MSSGVDPADQATGWTSSRTVISVVRLAMRFQRIIPFLLIISCGDDNKDAEPTTSPTGITSVSQSDPMMPSTGDGPIGTTGTSGGETGGDPSASGNSTTPTSGGTTGAPVECTDPEGQGMNSPCTDASGCGCASGHCALVPGFGGWCGECTEDADCPDAGGCRLADPFSKLGSKCDPGLYLGSSCQTDNACHNAEAPLCAEIYELPGGFVVKGCSECLTDADCKGGFCFPNEYLPALGGYRKCGYPPVGTICDVGTEQCGDTDYCVAQVVVNDFKLGVCGNCATNADCIKKDPAFPVCVAGDWDAKDGFTPTRCHSM